MNDDISRVDELAGKLQFSELTDVEQTELDALLLRNPEARHRFVSHLVLENDLYEDASGLLSPEVSTIPFKKVFLAPLAIAAALALGVWFLIQTVAFTPDRGPSYASVAKKNKILSTSVGIIRRVIGVEPTDGKIAIHSGALVYPGILNVATGLVQLDLYSGVSLVVEGPAQLDIVNPDKVILYAGKIRANVPPPARGFRLIAGEHELIDLGTEFGVSVDADGVGELHVIEGEVEVLSEKAAEKGAKLLTTGNAVSLNTDGTSPAIPADGGKFQGTKEMKERGSKRFLNWRKAIFMLASDPDTLALFDFSKTENNRLSNLAEHSGESSEGIVVGCEVGEGRWAEKSSLDFRNASDRVRVKIPGQFEQLTLATWIKAESIELLSLPFIQSENQQEHSLFWVLHHGHLDRPMTPHFVDTMDPDNSKGIRQTYFSGVEVLSEKQTGAWRHFAVTVDNSAKRVTHFVNGKVVDRIPIDNPRPVGIGLADIGNWPSRDWATDTKWEVRHLIGKMDEFLISKRAFTESEIRTLYKSGHP